MFLSPAFGAGLFYIYMKKIDLKVGYLTVQDRLFKVEFWTEDYFDLPYVKVSEVIKTKKKKNWFSNQLIEANEEACIGSGWTTSDRLAWAKKRILEHLKEERDRATEKENIEQFIGGGVYKMNENKFELHPCPFCKKNVVYIGVHDDEGNYKGHIGCEYESDPWSGLSYGLHHEGWGECILCTDGFNEVLGGVLFDTPEEAVVEWNKCGS